MIHVLLVVHATFHLGSATTCTSQSKSHVRINAINVGLYGNTVNPYLSGHNADHGQTSEMAGF